MADALVVADGPTTRSATTGTAGLVTLQALPVGHYDVRVTRSGFAPLETIVAVAAAAGTPTMLDLRVVATDLAGTRDGSAPAETAPSPADDPYVAHALAAAPDVDVVSAQPSSAATIDGTTRNDSRAEIDGVPLAASAARGAALAYPNALPLTSVDVEPGLAGAPADTPRDTVGGVVDYRTAAIESIATGGLEAGYDSAFGSYQHARFSGTFGRVGVLADAVTGGGANRTQVVKARYALSTTTSLGAASYTSQSPDVIAPVTVADLQTKLGTATFEARTYRSAARDTTEDDGARGTQIELDVPSGENRLALGFDRRAESTSLATGSVRQAFSTVSLRTGLQLGRDARLELADAYGSGTALAKRHDPHATLLVRASDRVTLRLSAASAYATAPLRAYVDAGAAERATLDVPETSFGYRASADVRLDPSDRAFAALYTLRRYDAFAALAGARSYGVDVGLERRAPRGGFGGLAFLRLDRSLQFDAPQPAVRNLDATPLLASQFPGDAYSKGRVQLDYRGRTGLDLRIGTTFLGANNAFAERSIALGDVAVSIPLGTSFDARIGLQNAFARAIADPILAREFAPRELTFTLGHR